MSCIALVCWLIGIVPVVAEMLELREHSNGTLIE